MGLLRQNAQDFTAARTWFEKSVGTILITPILTFIWVGAGHPQ